MFMKLKWQVMNVMKNVNKNDYHRVIVEWPCPKIQMKHEVDHFIIIEVTRRRWTKTDMN